MLSGRRTGDTPAGGRRAAHDGSGLRADAHTAADILAGHSETFGAEEILAHVEIARLVTETATAALRAEKVRGREARAERKDTLDLIDQALAALTAAHDAGVLDDEAVTWQTP